MARRPLSVFDRLTDKIAKLMAAVRMSGTGRPCRHMVEVQLKFFILLRLWNFNSEGRINHSLPSRAA